MRHTIWLTALLAIGCASPEREAAGTLGETEPRLPHAMAGCYALYDEDRLPASQSLHSAADRFRLDTVPGADGRSWKASRPGGWMHAGENAGVVYWEADSLAADSIRIRMHTGFSGSELILEVPDARSGRRLHGRALEHWDIGALTEDAGAVSAVRIPCGGGWG